MTQQNPNPQPDPERKPPGRNHKDSACPFRIEYRLVRPWSRRHKNTWTTWGKYRTARECEMAMDAVQRKYEKVFELRYAEDNPK